MFYNYPRDTNFNPFALQLTLFELQAIFDTIAPNHFDVLSLISYPGFEKAILAKGYIANICQKIVKKPR